MRKKRIPIFRKIFFPLMFLTIIEIFIVVGAMFAQGLIVELNENEKNVLDGRVEARKNYLESVMVNSWMQLDSTVADITEMTEKYLQANGLTAAQLDDSSTSAETLMVDITTRLIQTMRTNRVTGAYVILNAEDLSGYEVLPSKPGVYIRDNDPYSLVSKDNEDLFLKIFPIKVMESMGLSTDTDTEECTLFHFDSGESKKFADILQKPFEQAYNNNGTYTWQNMGRWDIVQDNDRYEEPMLSYTVPLILSDGTAIGVVGVDLTFEYLASNMLPANDLGYGNNGVYILAKYDKNTDTYYNVFGSGDTKALELCDENGLLIGENYYIHNSSLHLYETNTPFASDSWVIAGVVELKYLQAFANNLVAAAFVSIGFSIFIGVLCSLFLSYRMQRPLNLVAKEIAAADPHDALTLTETGIKEVDVMSDEMVKLSRDVLESGRKFSKILDMASIHMSGFQINRSTNSLFLTENFFSLFGDAEIDQSNMTVSEFVTAMTRYEQYLFDGEAVPGEYMLHMPIGNKYSYIRICINETESGNHVYGLAEDVTRDMLERQQLQYERDHDPLTNLYNRRAFRVRMEELLEQPEEELGLGAFIMIDLDNLKYFNDTFGHEYGDQYIICAARAIAMSTSNNSLCARISGDEFNIFMYGCATKDELAEQVKRVQVAINSGTVVLPDGTVQAIHATGGVAYYPEHSRSVEALSKFADYAMYIAKRGHKRSFDDYSDEMFRNQDIQLRNSEALTKMLQYDLVHYALQPIVDSKTGKIFAYEALMRPDVDKFFTVADVMETARRDGKLGQIEEMTLFKALELYDSLVVSGQMSQDTHIFINSIPNEAVSPEKSKQLIERYERYANRIVIELTEEEKVERNIWEYKERQHRLLGGKIALDDYGSGYNSEKTLIELSPDFIKIDMSIVRGIHQSSDKQQVVENIVRYAHDRGKFIIAEGVEDENEVRKLVSLKVDYMQGYFFGKPLAGPQTISKTALKALKAAQIGKAE